MNRIISHILVSCFVVFIASGQIPKAYQIASTGNNISPRSNTINDIVVRQDTIWLGTESGLSLTVNGGRDWVNFAATSSFGDTGISAMAINNSMMWIAKGYSTDLNGESVQTGGGLNYSTDRGSTWTYVPQPREKDKSTIDTLQYGNNRIRALAITVLQQNITFDIALTRTSVWIASWAGGLRRSTDLGQTWSRVILPPDDLDSIAPADSLNYVFNVSPAAGRLGLTANNNHLLFSVYASDDTTIWAGTAGGINKSVDGGTSWRKFNHQNQTHPISGNFVVALSEQRWRNHRIMWAATVNANDPDEIKGLSYTEDGGAIWKTALLGEWVHNISIKDSIVYVATDNGLFRSSDYGESWIRSGTIYDPTNLQRFVSTECYASGAKGDTVWFGGPEGTAYTIDSPVQQFGTVWHIFRTAEQVGLRNITYAFPNPFSPAIEAVRLHYSVTGTTSASQEVSIRVFDFGMKPVRTLIQNASRLPGKEYDEIWNGRNDHSSTVANGVYFYRVEISGQSPIWGKILVLR